MITLGYVREMGRVLRPGGIAFFQVSNQPEVHEKPPLRKRLRQWLHAALGRAPKGQLDPAWRGSMTTLNELRCVARAAGLDLQRVVGEGTQFCLVLLRKDERESQ